jgi:signal recognition particle subunit SEC65
MRKQTKDYLCCCALSYICIFQSSIFVSLFFFFYQLLDFNLKRSQGRKVPVNISVKKPNVEEIFGIAKNLGSSVLKSSKSHPSNWHSELGSINLFYDGTKVSLLHRIGTELKVIRKTD